MAKWPLKKHNKEGLPRNSPGIRREHREKFSCKRRKNIAAVPQVRLRRRHFIYALTVCRFSFSEISALFFKRQKRETRASNSEEQFQTCSECSRAIPQTRDSGRREYLAQKNLPEAIIIFFFWQGVRGRLQKKMEKKNWNGTLRSVVFVYIFPDHHSRKPSSVPCVQLAPQVPKSFSENLGQWVTLGIDEKIV